MRAKQALNRNPSNGSTFHLQHVERHSMPTINFKNIIDEVHQHRSQPPRYQQSSSPSNLNPIGSHLPFVTGVKAIHTSPKLRQMFIDACEYESVKATIPLLNCETRVEIPHF
ncbi:11302_t:CDS:2 [Ambispora leptoticha]|uniref:11302_t:CDS:1 n=1 Tax=Ambispora leptoticha TaxID=144679 RepID=A0A9N9CG49_9GLOM|nr:11302_t:CDS:2 [Ambispora leptoticha]